MRQSSFYCVIATQREWCILNKPSRIVRFVTRGRLSYAIEMTLYEDGKKIGEITEWKRTERFPEKKVFLGKEVMSKKPNDLCHFVSPKPVSWKKQLWVIADDGSKLKLSEIKIRGGTVIDATIAEEEKPKA
jgi:hypothetical protein